MAFIDENRFDDEDQDLLNRDQMSSTPGGSGAAVVSGSSQGSRAGVGAGGTGGWTNIQSYLNANKGESGSARALNNTVNSQFSNERDQIHGDSQKFLDDAYSQVQNNSIAPTQAQDILNQSAKQYGYGGTQSVDYQDNVNKVQGALNNQYSGPREYNYGLTNKTQEYGEALKNPGGFDTLMNDVYSKSAGRPLNPGAFNLQKQLDVNNTALAQARENLSNQYGALVADRDKTVSDTTGKLSGVEKQYRTNQTALKDWLYGKATDYQNQIDKAESDAKTAYQNELNTESGLSAAGYSVDPNSVPGPVSALIGANYSDNLVPFLRNMSWSNLAAEKNAGDKLAYADLYRDALKSNDVALQNFYNTEDDKYANTADQEERYWNSIQDFLNSGAARKEQGFKVRS